MANCKYCGTWAGVTGHEHASCADLAAKGLTPAQIIAQLQQGLGSKAAVPLSFRHIVGGVYLGVMLASITLGIMYAILSQFK